MQDIKNWITKLYDEMGETKEDARNDFQFIR